MVTPAAGCLLEYHARVILGEQVRLRRVERDDLPRFVQWVNDPEVRRHLALFYPMGMPQEEAWFEAQLRLEPALQAFSVDAHSLSAAGTLADPAWTHVGSAGFHTVDWRNRNAELGIVIGDKEFWGRGHGTDATRTLVRWAFHELNLERVWLRVFADNARAIRCYEKVGFRAEGRLRQDHYCEGRYFDTVVMGILRDELA